MSKIIQLTDADGNVFPKIYPEPAIVLTDTYSGATDIKSITDYAYSKAYSLGLVSTGKAVCFRADWNSGTTQGVFGTASHTVIAWFSSANYGYGYMISDSVINFATFRRAGGANSNYVYKVSLTQA